MDNQFNDDELQKAIDDITKDAASGGSSSVVDDLIKKNEDGASAPAGKVVSASTDMDDGQPAFSPAPAPTVPPVTDASVPDDISGSVPEEAEEVIPGPEVPLPEEPAKVEEAPEVEAPATAPAPVAPTVAEAPVEPAVPAQPVVQPITEAPAVSAPVVAPVTDAPVAASNDFEKTREEALMALYPLMDKVSIDDPVQKFGMYKEMFGLMKNAEVAGSVLKAAEGIPDEQARADALMGLIKSIDEIK